MERLSGDLSWWKRGFGWGKSYLLEGGLVQQRLNTIITQMDWASWHPQLWNNTFWAQGVPLSPGFGEFSSGNFLRGGWVESELFYLPLCVPKALGGELGRHMWSSLLPNPRLGVSASSGSCQSLESRWCWILGAMHKLLPSQLLTLTEQVRAGDKYRHTTKAA